MTIRRVVLAAFLAFVALAVPGLTASAVAAPYTGAASLTALSSDPCVGGQNQYNGAGFVPGETVTLTSRGTTIVTVKADASGTFTVTFSLPKSFTGRVVITATGAKTSASTEVSVIRSCGSSSSPSGGAGASGVDAGGSSNGGTSSTGVAIALFLVVAAALIGGGAVLVVGGRRRGARS